MQPLYVNVITVVFGAICFLTIASVPTFLNIIMALQVSLMIQSAQSLKLDRVTRLSVIQFLDIAGGCFCFQSEQIFQATN